MDAAASTEASVPLEKLLATEVGLKLASLLETGVVHHRVALRRHFRSPRRSAKSGIVPPLLGRSVEILELPDDGWQQIRSFPEVVFHAWAEDEMRKYRFTVFPQRRRVAACKKTFAVTFADGVGMGRAGELVDLLGFLHNGLVGEHLVEANRDTVTVPSRGRWKADGYPVVYGAQNERISIARRQHFLFTGKKPIFDRFPNFVQKRRLQVQSDEKAVLLVVSRPAEILILRVLE